MGIGVVGGLSHATPKDSSLCGILNLSYHQICVQSLPPSPDIEVAVNLLNRICEHES
jgi:hypothetical protein